MGTNASKFRLALTTLTLVVLLLSVFAAVGRAAGTHSATEPTWYYRGVVTNDSGATMKHVTVVYDPDGLQGVAGTPKFMMWWGTGSAGQLFATTSNDGVNWSGTGTARAPLSVTFPSTVVPVYHPEVIYDRLGFDQKKSAGTVHFKMWFYDGGTEDYNWIRYAESADGVNWTVFEDSPCAAPACTNLNSKNYLEFSGGSGNEMSVLYRRGGTGIIVNGVDQEYVGYQAMNSLVGISTDGAWFFGVGGQGGGPTDVCREMVIAGDRDVVKYRAWDDLPLAGDLTSWGSATGLSWNSPAAGSAPIAGASWSSLYGAMAVVVVGDQYYMYDTLKSDNYSVGLLVASFGPPTVVWVDNDWTSQADVSAFDPSLIWQYDAFSSVQDGIDAVAGGGTVNVRPGAYNERVTIHKSVDLRGAQVGVDPTAAGARTNPANESIVDVTALGYANPDIAVEIVSGVSGVTIDGFTLIGDPTNTLADTSVIRCGGSSGIANGVTISHNIVDGKYGVLYKSGNTLTVHRNRMVVNKAGVTVQPGPASNVVVSENVISIGSAPAGDESGVYMTSCTQCSVTGNVIGGFLGRGIGGSNLHHLAISGNTCTGNNDAVSFWGGSTFIAVTDNVLANSLRYGISMKGQDLTITGNDVTNSGNTGINIERHVIDTERVEIHSNNITGNTNYGVKVDILAVTAMVNATCNWWGDLRGPRHLTLNPVTDGDDVTDMVYFQPWLTQPAPSDCDDVGPLTKDVGPGTVAVNTPVVLTANVDDTGTGDSIIASAVYSLDGSPWASMQAPDGSFFDDVSENVTATIPAFTDAGIHEVCVRGTDAAGNTGAEECALLAVYDPTGGFVTGGGWIWSPAGAYVQDSALTGKATFGFVSKYRKGAQIPEGQTEFVFQVANLDFRSTGYEWLVVAGAKAMYKGSGTINGAGAYKFMLTALDADANGSDDFLVDRFRIKIWTEDNGAEAVVYDNGLGADDQDDSATTEIGGGSIVIHTGRK